MLDRYGRLSHTIARSKALSPQAKVIYAVLDMCRNPKTGQCNPKQSTIAELSGMSRKATNRAIGELKERGVLIISGTRRRPFYRLQNDLFAAPISPTDGTDGGHESELISPTGGTT
jgi:biotin operon repressor